MDRTGASCYIYAKASGMLAKSFTGSRTVNLFNAKSLQELWGLLFTDEVPAVPQTLLAQEIEKKAALKFIEDYRKLLMAYSEPEDILVDLLQWFDYENLKNAAGKLSAGNNAEDDFQTIKPFNILKYEKWPDLEKMTAGTELSWYNKIPELEEESIFANKVDTQFIKKIWGAVEKLSVAEREVAEKVISKHYSMMNITWAMRLKVYYNMDSENIKNHLIYLDDRRSSTDKFAGEALKILDKKIDAYEDWSKWKYAKLLNLNDDARYWKLDPAYFEKQVSKDFIASMKREFHKNPFSSMVMVTWFFIKRAELDSIRTATEAIRLNVDQESLVKNM